MLAHAINGKFTAHSRLQTPSGIPFSELESRIDVLVAEHLGVSTPGVAIVVVYNGEIIFSKDYGYADIEQGILLHIEEDF